ncbi:MAG: LysR family transcriptional regulator [Pseudomonadota bacterium]
MKLRHIEVINAVLQTGSLSAAARLLNISQPSATKHLQHAEATVGYPLFRRHAGRLHPTQELMQLAPAIRNAYAGFDDVRRLAGNLRGRPQPRLRVGTVPAMSVLVSPAYAALRQQHPEVRCEFSTGHHHELVQWLLLREIDLAIAFDPPTHPAVALDELASLRLVCAGRPEVLGKYRSAASVPAAALATMPVIELVNTDPVGRLMASYAEQFDWRFPAPLVVKTHQVALQLAAHGFGVAVVDGLSATKFEPALRVLPIEPQGEIVLRAMFLQPGALSAAASNFIAACRVALQAASESTRVPAASRAASDGGGAQVTVFPD